MSRQCSWPTHSWPLEGRCLYHTLLGLTSFMEFECNPDTGGVELAHRLYSASACFPRSAEGVMPIIFLYT